MASLTDNLSGYLAVWQGQGEWGGVIKKKKKVTQGNHSSFWQFPKYPLIYLGF